MLSFVFDRLRPYVATDHRQLDRAEIGLFLGIGAALCSAALIGVGWSAGFEHVWHDLLAANWKWLAVAPLGVAVSHLGYIVAYRGVTRAQGGPHLSTGETAALVITGFGVFLPRGGFSFDTHELQDLGLPHRDARQRVLTLGILEYTILAPATFGAALAMLCLHQRTQSGLVPSWVIGVPLGSATTLALWHRRRKSGGLGWPKPLAHFPDAIEMAAVMIRSTPSGPAAATGMALYWAGDIAALGVCLAAFTHQYGTVSALIVGYATGYALTRRTLPLAGAGAVEAFLPFALSWVYLPLPAAVLAVCAYRFCNLWLTIAPAETGLRRLRRQPGMQDSATKND